MRKIAAAGFLFVMTTAAVYGTNALLNHYRFHRLAHHFILIALAWLLALSFLRWISRKPKPRPSVEVEDELSYLSKTYQSLSTSLRQERQKVESILNSAPDGIFCCSPDGKITFWNRSMETLTGLTREHAVEKHYRECLNIFSATGQLLAEPFSPCFNEGKNLTLFDSQIETTGWIDGTLYGNSLPVSIGAAPVRTAEGAVEEIVITVKDIRALKEAEKLKKDMQAMIAHDLRSPVAAILGYAGLIQNARLTKNESDAQKYMESLVRAAKGMLILIGNLLGWSGVESGRISVHKEPVSIVPLLKEMADSLEILARPKNLAIKLQMPDEVWAMADSEKLKEVLTNLVTNAIKFSRAGTAITVTAKEESETTVISVADCGPGIPLEEQDKLFEKFTTLRGKGSQTGLGLFIVKTLTEAMEGSVSVESEVGEGSTFTVTLPGFVKVTSHPRQLSMLTGAGVAES